MSMATSIRACMPSASSGSDSSIVVFFSGVNIMNTKVQYTTLVGGMPAIPSQVDAVAARTRAINSAGVRSHPLDLFDQRIIDDMINDTGRRCIFPPDADCITYQSYASGTAPLDTDNDGMPDTWETAHGLNPSVASDGPALHSNGYSNLENYINHLAGDEFDEGSPVEPSTGDVKVCIDDHTSANNVTDNGHLRCEYGHAESGTCAASMSVTSGTEGAGGGLSMGPMMARGNGDRACCGR